ncbi:MAG: hypothetical protein AAGF04_01090 [Chlamydiota bacterium]
MKSFSKRFIPFFLAMLFLGSSLSAFSFFERSYPDIEGSYLLVGKSKRSASSYRGIVEINRVGDNYSLIWKIGTSTTQAGIGIFQGDILSVAFYDLNDPEFTGVASFRLTDEGNFEGPWASSNSSGGQGKETLRRL